MTLGKSRAKVFADSAMVAVADESRCHPADLKAI